MEKITNIPVDVIFEHPDNPRKSLGNISELTQSIRANGIMQNLTVVPMSNSESLGVAENIQCYRVIIGHRRLAAAKRAGLVTVPCVIVDMDYKAQLSTMLTENMQRVELTPYEQAEGFQLMFDLGDSVEEIALKSGFNKQTVKHRLEIAKLDKANTLQALDSGFTLEDFALLEQIENIEDRNKMLESSTHRSIQRDIENYFREQKIKEQEKKIIAELSSRGFTEVPESVNTVTDKKYKYINSFIFDRFDSDALPKAKDLMYKIRLGNWLYLYELLDEEEVNEEVHKRAEEEADRKFRRESLDTQAQRLNVDIFEFCHSVKNNYSNKITAISLISSMLILGDGRTVSLETLCRCADFDEEELPGNEAIVNGKIPLVFVSEIIGNSASFLLRIAVEFVKKYYGGFSFFDYNNFFAPNNIQRCVMYYLKELGFVTSSPEQELYITGRSDLYVKHA